MNKPEGKKYAAALTVGCRLNQTDTALIFSELKRAGYEIVNIETDNPLSIIVINTCAVTNSASQKSRQYTNSLKKKHLNAKIIVTGCDVEVDKEKWKRESGADYLVSNSDKLNILKYLSEIIEDNKADNKAYVSNGSDTFSLNTTGFYPFKKRANIKIQDGCDSFCTYCIVPYGRGTPRSREFNNTIEEFKQLLEAGHKEIILTGVNIATYNSNGKNLVDLVDKMCSIDGDFRIRLSSTEPQFQVNDLIDLLAANDKICRFLHLPIQHTSDRVLKMMGRKYKAENFSNFVTRALNKIKNISIGTDVIVGFPSETEDDFKSAELFLSSLPLSYLHVFRYSKRKRTPAAGFKDQIPHKIINARHNSLSKISEKLTKNFLSSQLGATANVIFEDKRGSIFSGWSDNYIKTHMELIKIAPKEVIGKISKVKFIEIRDGKIFASMI